jgi:hypothetical protein
MNGDTNSQPSKSKAAGKAKSNPSPAPQHKILSTIFKAIIVIIVIFVGVPFLLGVFAGLAGINGTPTTSSTNPTTTAYPLSNVQTILAQGTIPIQSASSPQCAQPSCGSVYYYNFTVPSNSTVMNQTGSYNSTGMNLTGSYNSSDDKVIFAIFTPSQFASFMQENASLVFNNGEKSQYFRYDQGATVNKYLAPGKYYMAFYYPGKTAGTLSITHPIVLHIQPTTTTTIPTTTSITTTTIPNNGRLSATPATLGDWISGRYASAKLFANMSGGKPPYSCALAPGSVLPYGLTLSACKVSGVHKLDGGTTKEISPFTVIIRDSASPAASLSFNLSITTVRSGPILIPHTGHCVEGTSCDTVVATAKNGTPPYAFTSAQPAPPLNLMVDMNGHLIGTPEVQGTYNISVCATDMVGSEACNQTSVVIIPPTTTTIETGGNSGLTSVAITAWCNTGLDSLGWPNADIGASGTATGQGWAPGDGTAVNGGAGFGIYDSGGNSNCTNPLQCGFDETLNCNSWSQWQTDECVRDSSSEPTTTSWNSTGMSIGGGTSTFTVTFWAVNWDNDTILATTTAVCPTPAGWPPNG